MQKNSTAKYLIFFWKVILNQTFENFKTFVFSKRNLELFTKFFHNFSADMAESADT